MADPTQGREHPSFSFPVMRQYTGKVQYRIDGMSATDIPDVGRTLRGEVKALKPKLAARLVADGNHAHVPADTPIGQPEEFQVTKKAAAKQLLSVVIRKAIREKGTDMSIDHGRRLMELADAAESSEQVNADSKVGAANAKLYSQIEAEYAEILASYEPGQKE